MSHSRAVPHDCRNVRESESPCSRDGTTAPVAAPADVCCVAGASCLRLARRARARSRWRAARARGSRPSRSQAFAGEAIVPTTHLLSTSRLRTCARELLVRDGPASRAREGSPRASVAGTPQRDRHVRGKGVAQRRPSPPRRRATASDCRLGSQLVEASAFSSSFRSSWLSWLTRSCSARSPPSRTTASIWSA